MKLTASTTCVLIILGLVAGCPASDDPPASSEGSASTGQSAAGSSSTGGSTDQNDSGSASTGSAGDSSSATTATSTGLAGGDSTGCLDPEACDFVCVGAERECGLESPCAVVDHECVDQKGCVYMSGDDAAVECIQEAILAGTPGRYEVRRRSFSDVGGKGSGETHVVFVRDDGLVERQREVFADDFGELWGLAESGWQEGLATSQSCIAPPTPQSLANCIDAIPLDCSDELGLGCW